MVKPQKSYPKKRIQFDTFIRRMQRILRPILVGLIIGVAVNVSADFLSAPADTEPTVKSLLIYLINQIWGTAWYQLLILSLLGIFSLCLLVGEAYVYIRPRSTKQEENDERFKQDLVSNLVMIFNGLLGEIKPPERPSLSQVVQDLKADVAEQKTLVDALDIQNTLIPLLRQIAKNSEALDVTMKDNIAIRTSLEVLVSHTSYLKTLKVHSQNIQDLLLAVQSLSTSIKNTHSELHQIIQELSKHLKRKESNTAIAVSSDVKRQSN